MRGSLENDECVKVNARILAFLMQRSMSCLHYPNLTLTTVLGMEEAATDGLWHAQNSDLNPGAGSGNVTDLLLLVHSPRFRERSSSKS